MKKFQILLGELEMKNKKTEIECEINRNVEGVLMETEIQYSVFQILEELCFMPVQHGNQTLLEDFSMDSLRMVMLLVTLEERFEIELDESDMNPFELITADDVVNLVKKYVLWAKEGHTHA